MKNLTMQLDDIMDPMNDEKAKEKNRFKSAGIIKEKKNE